jgi:hypothetical protein
MLDFKTTVTWEIVNPKITGGAVDNLALHRQRRGWNSKYAYAQQYVTCIACWNTKADRDG